MPSGLLCTHVVTDSVAYNVTHTIANVANGSTNGVSN